MEKCSYNGTILPALPEYDKETYPYAAIVFNGTEYKLCLKRSSYTVYTSGDYVGINPMNYPKYRLVDGAWESFAQTTTFYSTPIWANHDLYYQDDEELAGTLYLAASEPVPILAPVIDPLSMWLGYQAGQWVVRQRGKKAEEEKTPVAYLYGGLRAPDVAKLPYPFVFMFQSGDTVLAYCMQCPVTRLNGEPYRPFTENAIYDYQESDGGTEWNLGKNVSVPDSFDPEIFVSAGLAVWMNYDYVDSEYVYLPGFGWPEEVRQMFGDFPALDTEKYPYWCVGQAVSTGVTPDYCLFGSTEKGYWEDGVFKIGGTYCIFSATAQDDGTVSAFTLYGDNQTAEYPFSNLFYPMTSNYLAYTNDYDSSKAIISASEIVPVGDGMAVYDGVRLPGLPEWDKAKYPYAFIETTFGLYYLRVLANPLTPDGDYFRFIHPGLVAGATIDAATGEYTGWREWSEVTENTRTPLWSNVDVLNEDGTVYLAASEPVPVYE